MSLWRIAWIYLWSRMLTTSLTILSVALAVGLISAILTLRNETRARFEEEQQAYDIVVGPPGSPLQLVLNAVYFLDSPTGALPYSVYERLKAHKHVEHAFPIGLGDTYKGFRIVGTDPAIFEYPWTSSVTGEDRFPFQIAEGRFFMGPLEAVVGYRVALNTGLEVGDRFTGTHGRIEFSSDIAEYDHSASAYEVVGILKPSGTSNDRAIFVDLQSVWDLHAHADEGSESGEVSASKNADGGDREEERLVTAVLIDLYSPAQRFSFMEYVMREYAATPAIPVVQILRLYNQILAPAVIIMMSVGYVVVIISALSILIGLYLSIIQRKRDLAIMRALGASAYEIFGAVMIEAFLVTVMGVAAGWILGKSVAFGLGMYMSRAYGFNIAGLGTSSEELGFFAIVAMVGLLAGIVPAWQAYRTDVARDLQAI